jgi:hypothetical protein
VLDLVAGRTNRKNSAKQKDRPKAVGSAVDGEAPTAPVMQWKTRFRIRETPDWKQHAAALETEMLRRGMLFVVIDWSEDQTTLPFEE